MQPHPFSKLLLAITIVVIGGAATTIGYYAYNTHQVTLSPTVKVAITTATPTPTEVPTASPTPLPSSSPTPTTVKAVASQANQAVSTINLSDISATVASLNSTLNAFNQ